MPTSDTAADEPRYKRVLRGLLAAAMIAVGIAHFAAPEPFVAIVPPWLPAPLALVLVSGFFEIALGLGLLHPRTRSLAGWGLVALYVAVFPANIHMALHQVPLGDMQPNPVALWGRLPLQAVFIA
ncbi:MAG: DoxX family protein, partial [Myxococcales bacterium]|nr:DoxX family protein [Myxococcales bacterium]